MELREEAYCRLIFLVWYERKEQINSFLAFTVMVKIFPLDEKSILFHNNFFSSI